MKQSKFPLTSEFKILSIKTKYNVNFNSTEPWDNSIAIRIIFTLDKEDMEQGLMRGLLGDYYESNEVSNLELHQEYIESLIMTKTSVYNKDGTVNKMLVGTSIESSTEIAREDVYSKVYLKGDGMLSYYPKQNFYIFNEFFCFTPTVEAILREIQGLRMGINLHKTTCPYVLRDLLTALANFWH